jgi:hypothetical protein
MEKNQIQQFMQLFSLFSLKIQAKYRVQFCKPLISLAVWISFFVKTAEMQPVRIHSRCAEALSLKFFTRSRENAKTRKGSGRRKEQGAWYLLTADAQRP